MHDIPSARDFSVLIPILPVHSSAFFQTSPELFLYWLCLEPVPVCARKIKLATLLIVIDN